MKKILFTLMAVFLSTAMYSQYYYVPYLNAGKNPGELNKDMENPFPAQAAGWTSLWSGDGSSAVTYTANQTIPFSFNFNGSAVTSYKVSNAGFVTFSTDATENLTTFKNETLPNASIPDKSIAVLGIKPISSTSGATTYKSAILTKTFGTAPNRQLWIQFNYFGEANISAGWTYWSVVLEESTNNVYIVDTKTLCVTNGQLCTNNVKLSAGIQIDATNAEVIKGSPDLGANYTAANIFDASDNSYYKFMPGVRPENDMAALRINMDNIILLRNAPFTISGTFLSNGSKDVSNFDFAYQINGGTPVIANVNATVSTGGMVTVNHPTTWNPTGSGKYTVTIWAASINGATDEVSSNDKISFSVFVGDKTEERTVLHEVFTSSTCPPCKPGNENTDQNVFPNIGDKFTVIKYQQDFPGTGDPYATKESVNRRNFYGINSIPRMEVDGGWDGNAQIYTTDLFEGFQAKPSFFKIDAKHILNFKTVTVNVDITPLANFSNPNLRMFVALNEKRTVKNIKTNGEEEFFHVMKKMLPNENGTAIGDLTSETTKNMAALTYAVPGSYRLPSNGVTANQIKLATENSVEDFANLEVVVFIQDVVTREIFQSAYSAGTITGIDDKEIKDAAFAVYPNPANNEFVAALNFTQASRASFNLHNVLGQQVLSIKETNYPAGVNNVKFDVSSLQPGVYYVNMLVNGQQSVQKIVVSH